MDVKTQVKDTTQQVEELGQDVKAQVKGTARQVEKFGQDVKTQVKDTAQQVEKFGQENMNVVVKTAHKSFQAGLGVVALGAEEVEAMIKRLVEKGEVAEKDGRKLVDGWLSRGREPMNKYEGKVEGMLDHRIESVLQAMNIPSKSDIEDLTKKIAALSKKVADMDKKLAPEKKIAA